MLLNSRIEKKNKTVKRKNEIGKMFTKKRIILVISNISYQRIYQMIDVSHKKLKSLEWKNYKN
jgi:hypothetical protein